MAIIRRKLGRNPALAERANEGLMSSLGLISLARENNIETEPLDITRLTRNLGLTLIYEDMDDDISGHLQKDKDSGKWLVTINQRHHERRQRFTIAHELGHYFLHQSKSDDFIDATAILFRNNVSNPMESEANKFAAEILMPKEAFTRKVSGGMTRIEDLANYFDVSALSIRIRAKQLGFQGHGA